MTNTTDCDCAYEARIRAMVLVDLTDDEQFAIKHGGAIHAVYEDPLKACDHAAEMAAARGCKWDVTLHARNAADMA